VDRGARGGAFSRRAAGKGPDVDLTMRPWILSEQQRQRAKINLPIVVSGNKQEDILAKKLKRL